MLFLVQLCVILFVLLELTKDRKLDFLLSSLLNSVSITSSIPLGIFLALLGVAFEACIFSFDVTRFIKLKPTVVFLYSISMIAVSVGLFFYHLKLLVLPVRNFNPTLTFTSKYLY